MENDRKEAEATLGEMVATWLSKELASSKHRAALRRATNLEDFKSCWTVAGMLVHLRAAYSQKFNESQLLPAVWAVGRTRKVSRGSFPAMCKRSGVKEQQLRKLTGTSNRTEAARQVRRLTSRIPDVPVADIVNHIYYWGEHNRRDWAIKWFEGSSSD